MTDSIIPTGALAESRQFIADLGRRIEERRQATYEKIQRIRQRARADEDYEFEREYFEIEPLRRQMEAMIRNLADYESLKAPSAIMNGEGRE